MNQPSIAQSQSLFAQAQRTIPGGVNSPVRAFRSVGGTPRFFTRAQGPYLWDADGNRYVDTICSWGPAIVGHAHPEVIAAVQKAAEGGLSFGAPTRGEVELAEWVRDHLPSMEMMRLTSSGTEATMSAIRVARGYTGRNKIVKFEGCYHGHVDSLLVKAGSGLLTFGNPTSAGVPESFANETIVLDYNDVEGVKACFASHGAQIAAVIVEPIAGNMNLVRPVPGFLEALRSLCSQHGSVLIFDEVMTGFRWGRRACKDSPVSRQTSPPWARSLAGACPWVPSVAEKRSCSAWRHWARSTRRARSRATRWPWPQAWPPCALCRRPASLNP